MITRLWLGSSAAVLLSVQAAFATVNLVGNGSFETPVITEASPQPAGSMVLAPWYITGQGVDFDVAFQAADGNQIAGTSWQASSALHQDLMTLSGQMYQFTFAATSERPEGNSSIRSMDVLWNNSIVASLSFNPAGNTDPNMGWQYFTYNVMGTGSDTISFVDSSPVAGYGVALDDVSVVAVVPEPSVALLTIAGLLALTVALWKRG